MILGDLEWYALRTPPQKEFIAQEILSRKGFEVFLPVEMRLRRKTRYCKARVLKPFPMLVSYLFVKAEDGGLRWRDLFNMSCVQSVVSFDGEPYAIEQTKIDELEQLAHNQQPANQHRYLYTHNEFEEGDEVCIAEGPFAGRLVYVDQISGDKAKVWLNLFGVTRKIDIDVHLLEAVE